MNDPEVMQILVARHRALLDEAERRGMTVTALVAEREREAEKQRTEWAEREERRHVESGGAAREDSKVALVRKRLEPLGSAFSVEPGHTPLVRFQGVLTRKQNKTVRQTVNGLPFRVELVFFQ